MQKAAEHFSAKAELEDKSKLLHTTSCRSVTLSAWLSRFTSIFNELCCVLKAHSFSDCQLFLYLMFSALITR